MFVFYFKTVVVNIPNQKFPTSLIHTMDTLPSTERVGPDPVHRSLQAAAFSVIVGSSRRRAPMASREVVLKMGTPGTPGCAPGRSTSGSSPSGGRRGCFVFFSIFLSHFYT